VAGIIIANRRTLWRCTGDVTHAGMLPDCSGARRLANPGLSGIGETDVTGVTTHAGWLHAGYRASYVNTARRHVTAYSPEQGATGNVDIRGSGKCLVGGVNLLGGISVSCYVGLVASAVSMAWM
jgi:hypothetical protein